MAKVIVGDMTVESALKKFTQRCNNEGIRQELKRREYYVSKGEKRRLKHQEYLRKMNMKRNG